MTDDDRAEWRPPYVSYETLCNFVEKRLGSQPLPPRVDKGFLDNYAGSVQAVLLSALKTIGFIDEQHTVQPALKEAAAGPDDRKAVMRRWASTYYARQVELAEQAATAQMLQESFASSGYTGSTLRKAIVFYLTLAKDLDLPSSPHFKPPRQTPVSNGATQRKPKGNGRTAARTQPDTPVAAGAPYLRGTAGRRR